MIEWDSFKQGFNGKYLRAETGFEECKQSPGSNQSQETPERYNEEKLEKEEDFDERIEK